MRIIALGTSEFVKHCISGLLDSGQKVLLLMNIHPRCYILHMAPDTKETSFHSPAFLCDWYLPAITDDTKGKNHKGKNH